MGPKPPGKKERETYTVKMDVSEQALIETNRNYLGSDGRTDVKHFDDRKVRLSQKLKVLSFQYEFSCLKLSFFGRGKKFSRFSFVEGKTYLVGRRRERDWVTSTSNIEKKEKKS